MASTSTSNQQEKDMLLHLHPLTFSLNNLEELNSIELSLVPFHFNTNKNFNRQAKILWLKRRDWSLNNLNNLNSNSNLLKQKQQQSNNFNDDNSNIIDRHGNSSASSTSLPPPLPPHILQKYNTLFNVLEENKRSGETKPSRGLLARQLLELDKNLYERTRTQSFRFYVNDALRDGIVRFGKTRNREWVELVDRSQNLPSTITSSSSHASTSNSTQSNPPSSSSSSSKTLDSFYTTDLNFPFKEQELMNLTPQQLTLMHLKSYHHESAEARITERAEIAWWKKRARDQAVGLIWVEPDLSSSSGKDEVRFDGEGSRDRRGGDEEDYDRRDRTHRDEELPRDGRRRDENRIETNDKRDRGGRDKIRDRGRDRTRDSTRQTRSDSNQNSSTRNTYRRRSSSRSRSRSRSPNHRPFSSSSNNNKNRSRSYSPLSRPRVMTQEQVDSNPHRSYSRSPSPSRFRSPSPSRSRSRTVSISQTPLQPPSPTLPTNLNYSDKSTTSSNSTTSTSNKKFNSTFQRLPSPVKILDEADKKNFDVEMKDVGETNDSDVAAVVIEGSKESSEDESSGSLAVARQLALDSIIEPMNTTNTERLSSPSPPPAFIPSAISRPSEFNLRLQPTLKIHFPSLPSPLKTVVLRDDYFQSSPINVLAWTPGGPTELSCTFYLAFPTFEAVKEVEIYFEEMEIDWAIEGIIISRENTQRWLEEDLVPRGVSEGYWCDDLEDKEKNGGEKKMDIESRGCSPVRRDCSRSHSPVPTSNNNISRRSRSISPTLTPIVDSSPAKKVKLSSPTTSTQLPLPESEISNNSTSNPKSSTSKISPIQIVENQEPEFDIDYPIDSGPDNIPYPTVSFFGLPIPSALAEEEHQSSRRDGNSSKSKRSSSSTSKSTRRSINDRSSEGNSRKSSSSNNSSNRSGSSSSSSSRRYKDDYHYSHSRSSSSSRSRSSGDSKAGSSSLRKADHSNSSRGTSSPKKSRDLTREIVEEEAEAVAGAGSISRDSSVEIIEVPKVPKIEEE